MVASYKRLTLKAACGFLLCIMGLLTSGSAIAQNTDSSAASKPSSAARPRKDTAGSAAPTQLDGCLTASDGLMPKLALLRSRKIYRL
jgi:hypothetical protein